MARRCDRVSDQFAKRAVLGLPATGSGPCKGSVERILTKDALIRLARAHAELERLHERLRCSSCGGEAGDLWITLPNAYG